MLRMDREQRLVLILGAILGVLCRRQRPRRSSNGRRQFRKRLERAREDLASFMNQRCGLVDPAVAHARPRPLVRLARMEALQEPRCSLLEEVAEEADRAIGIHELVGHRRRVLSDLLRASAVDPPEVGRSNMNGSIAPVGAKA